MLEKRSRLLNYLGYAFTWTFHVCKTFICKAFKGAAVIGYCKPLITQTP